MWPGQPAIWTAVADAAMLAVSERKRGRAGEAPRQVCPLEGVDGIVADAIVGNLVRPHAAPSPPKQVIAVVPHRRPVLARFSAPACLGPLDLQPSRTCYDGTLPQRGLLAPLSRQRGRFASASPVSVAPSPPGFPVVLLRVRACECVRVRASACVCDLHRHHQGHPDGQVAFKSV